MTAEIKVDVLGATGAVGAAVNLVRLDKGNLFGGGPLGHARFEGG